MKTPINAFAQPPANMTAHISNDGLNREESVAEHTQKTTFLCKEKGRRCGISHMTALCGILHDIGKNKEVFNAYLHADERTRRKQKGSIAHASTGAKYIYDLRHGDSGNGKVVAELIAYAVAAHHGLFDCVDIEGLDVFSKKVDVVEDYEEACANAERQYLREYEIDGIYAEAVEEFNAAWNKCKDIMARLKTLLSSEHGSNEKEMRYNCKFFLLACFQRLLLSVLIDSDWEATSDFMENVDTLSKGGGAAEEDVFGKAKDHFEAYMRKKRLDNADSGLTDKERMILKAREELQKECVRFAGHPAGIYCLPIPTGGGKTLSSLAYGLEFCRLHPETERIIYVSPYISITEQNAQVFREAIGNDRWILEHHSSVVRNEETEDEDYRTHGLGRYDINWQEPFICTTFVQFMNTLFSDKSESIRRMHRLVNAVVIIDEVQAMPLKCVHTFNYMINFLNVVCNTNVVLCTATQPTFGEAGCPLCYSQPKYMINNVTERFHEFERVKISVPRPDEKYTLESLGEEIAERTAKHKSILVVLNTKSAVRKLYDLLKAMGVNAEYLTTNLCAEHRKDKLQAIRETLDRKDQNIVVISTNLIEAGVDISFECVYRSMTGLDSLAQTAGRCNRNGEMDSGKIYLIMLEGENSGNMEELQQKIRVTERVIREYKNDEGIDSLLMPRWMDEYYKEIYIASSEKMNFPIEKLDRNILELLSWRGDIKGKKNIMNQAYKTAGHAYRVIDDCSFGVIVPYKKGEEIIEAIQRAVKEGEIRSCIRQAQRYTVNVRGSQLKRFEGLLQPVSDQLPDLYMVAAPGAYSDEYGIAPEWETLIF